MRTLVDVVRALALGLALAMIAVTLAALLMFAAPAAAQEDAENPMPNREYYDGVQDPRFSTAETVDLNDLIEQYDVRWNELQDELNGAWIDDRQSIMAEIDDVEDRQYRAVEDLIQAHTEAVVDYPVEGPSEERLELLEDKRDALETLSDYAGERLSYSSPLRESGAGPAAALEDVQAEIEAAQAQEQPAGAEGGQAQGGGDGVVGSGSSAGTAPQEEGGINVVPAALTVLAVAVGAWMLREQLGALFRRPLASAASRGSGGGPFGGTATSPRPAPSPAPGSEPQESEANPNPPSEPEPGPGSIWDELDDLADDDLTEEQGRSEGREEGRVTQVAEESSEERQKPGQTPLETYCRNLTLDAHAGGLHAVVGRDEETSRVVRTLSRQTKSNPVLIGEAGVGKTAIAEGLAQRIADGDVPAKLRSAFILEVDLSALEAGTSMRGMFEERLKGVIDQAIEINRSRDDARVILFVDELHRLMGSGSHDGSPSPAAQMLKPALARGELSMLGATTIDEYRQIEKDPAIERRFQPVRVEPLSVEDTITVLGSMRGKIGAGDVDLADDAIEAAAKLTDRYVADRNLPDKAIDALDEAAAALRNSKVKGSRVLTAADVARVVHEISGVEVGDPDGEDLGRLAGLEDRLRERVKGQDAALSSVSEMIRRKRVGLSDETKPISALFFGPTGSGKTELAKALAAELFGDERALIRLDMSEYGDRHTAARLTGAPPGYVGHDEGGQLTEAVRRKPYSVVLFDEIEKADPRVLDVLLQVLDDGRLTDSTGRTVNFSETILVLTTNAGAGELLAAGQSRPVGFAGQEEVPAVLEGEDAIKRALIGAGLRPEFVARIGAVCPFRPLHSEQVEEITAGLLEKTARRLRERSIGLKVEDAAVALLAAGGYSPQHGVRHLSQLLERVVDARISDMIYAGEIGEEDVLAVVVRDGKVTVEAAEPW